VACYRFHDLFASTEQSEVALRIKYEQACRDGCLEALLQPESLDAMLQPHSNLAHHTPLLTRPLHAILGEGEVLTECRVLQEAVAAIRAAPPAPPPPPPPQDHKEENGECAHWFGTGLTGLTGVSALGCVRDVRDVRGVSSAATPVTPLHPPLQPPPPLEPPAQNIVERGQDGWKGETPCANTQRSQAGMPAKHTEHEDSKRKRQDTEQEERSRKRERGEAEQEERREEESNGNRALMHPPQNLASPSPSHSCNEPSVAFAVGNGGMRSRSNTSNTSSTNTTSTPITYTTANGKGSSMAKANNNLGDKLGDKLPANADVDTCAKAYYGHDTAGTGYYGEDEWKA
jgi:hypothetical protein